MLFNMPYVLYNICCITSNPKLYNTDTLLCYNLDVTELV